VKQQRGRIQVTTEYNGELALHYINEVHCKLVIITLLIHACYTQTNGSVACTLYALYTLTFMLALISSYLETEEPGIAWPVIKA